MHIKTRLPSLVFANSTNSKTRRWFESPHTASCYAVMVYYFLLVWLHVRPACETVSGGLLLWCCIPFVCLEANCENFISAKIYFHCFLLCSAYGLILHRLTACVLPRSAETIPQRTLSLSQLWSMTACPHVFMHIYILYLILTYFHIIFWSQHLIGCYRW